MEKYLLESINLIEPRIKGCNIYLQQGKKITSLLNPYEFLKTGLNLYGQDIESGKRHYRDITGFVQKAIIPFRTEKITLFFPTHAYTNEACIFIHYQFVNKVIIKNKSSLILFKDGTCFETKTDIRILKKQMLRCRKYLDLIKEREEKAYTILKIEMF